MRLAWRQSLHLRLLAGTLAAMSVALVLAGVVLSSLFRQQVERQFQDQLLQQLDQLTASIDFGNAQGADPLPLTVGSLSDPRWHKPYSGLYWQIDAPALADAPARQLRSRSLWDSALTLAPDELPDGAVHTHHGTGPAGASLLMLERSVHAADRPGQRWRITVAGDTHELDEAVRGFTGALVASLAVLLGLLMLAAWAQLAVGLRPLRALSRALTALRQGRTQRLQGEFPAELKPLTDDFNEVLERHAQWVERARRHAGNLAHAIKTPLAVMGQAAAEVTQRADQGTLTHDIEAARLARLVSEQVHTANRHIDWHLAQARVAGVQRLPGQRAPLAHAIHGLVRVMQRVHPARVSLNVRHVDEALAFAGEEQDLHEMLGNVLDNACKWARSRVDIEAQREASAPLLTITIEDDGPGVEPAQRQRIMARGVRTDESVPGSGLGLAIVADLVAIYGGSVALAPSALGGLKVTLTLPAAV